MWKAVPFSAIYPKEKLVLAFADPFTRKRPIMLYQENKARKKGFSTIIGIDEAGRGSLAGPVVASAVFLKNSRFASKISDSKKMSRRQREKTFDEICLNAYVGIGIISESVIDYTNILQATYYAMSVAVDDLIKNLPETLTAKKSFSKKVFLLIDGNSFYSELPYRYETIIKGDNLSLSIACASVIAKVTRDRILRIYDKAFPRYGFKKHKGYSTKEHRRAIRKHGPSIIHRKTFKYF